MIMLPAELWAHVFAYLPAKDLDTVQLVCAAWKDIASDKIWKQQFFDSFGTNDITPAHLPFSRWRQELLTRNNILHRWKRCSKQVDLTFNSTLLDNTHIFSSLNRDAPKLVCFNSHRGAGTIIELEKGKVKRRFYASAYRREELPVAELDGSRFGMLCGYLNGTVATISFTREGTLATDFTFLPYRHETAVSAVWVAKTRTFSKLLTRSLGLATGSYDGQVALYSSSGVQFLHPERSPVLMLEGSMYGSHTSEDGDMLVAFYKNGSLYKFTYEEDKFVYKKLAQLPSMLETTDYDSQLHLCNNYVVIQTPGRVVLIDVQTLAESVLSLPENISITAFSIERSHAPGTKHAAAGLSSNELCVWQIPALVSPENSSGELTRIELVKPKQSRSLGALPNADARKDLPDEVEPARSLETSGYTDKCEPERKVLVEPIWSGENPIGHDDRLSDAGKPHVTQVALNSTVLLAAGYNGMVVAVDVLTGRTLKKINSRISKNVLDLTRYSRDGLVPVTHLEIDPDPAHLRCIIVVRPAVQYLDLGCVGNAKQRPSDKAKHLRAKHRNGPSSLTSARHEMQEALETNTHYEEIAAEQGERDATLRAEFTMDDLEDEEQLAYAMMLSQNQSTDGEIRQSEDDDDDLRLALQLSTIELDDQPLGDNSRATGELSAEFPESADLTLEDPSATDLTDDDEELRRAIALSLQTM